MDFAPYQSSPPEHSRVASPDYNTPAENAPNGAGRRPFSPNGARTPPPLQHPQPQRSWAGFDGQPNRWASGESQSNPVAEISEFDTSLGLRLDYEASLAYLAFPPLGAIVLLILEKNSDYVRFHAWQSALVFTAMLLVHLVFAWSRFLSWILFIGDVAIAVLLAIRAYRDAEILDRFEIPFIGSIASRILDDE